MEMRRQNAKSHKIMRSQSHDTGMEMDFLAGLRCKVVYQLFIRLNCFKNIGGEEDEV